VEAANRLAAAADSARSVSESAALEAEQASPGPSSNPAALRERVLAIARDRTLHPAVRWQNLQNMVYLPCTNTRELLFGPGPDLQAAWARAREDLVRYPSDGVLFHVHADGLERMDRSVAAAAAEGSVGARAIQVIEALLGNHRLATCTAMSLVF
jgi:hypothetical protein